MTALSPDEVVELTAGCLMRPGEDQSEAVEVEGIATRFAFHRGRVAERRPRIAAQLRCLPDEFWRDRDGGWTFLNLCVDRDGRQWTGMHSVMEQLVCLGIASGQASWLADRELWKVLPGGMPYLEVHPDPEEKEDGGAAHQPG